MAKKPTQPDEPKEQDELVARIDAMMDTTKVDGSAVKIVKDQPAVSDDAPQLEAPIKIKLSAPELPGKLKKKVEEPTPEPVPASVAKKVVPITSEETGPANQPGPIDDAPDESSPRMPVGDTPDSLGDGATDKAVDDIVAKEGDMVLAVEDAKKSRQSKAKPASSTKDKLKALLKNKWMWLAVIALLAVLFGVPASRYKLLGLVIKKSITIEVVDSKTAAPVSNAELALAGNTAKTDNDGKAIIKAPVGKQALSIKKQYFKPVSSSYFVSLGATAKTPVRLTATGRLVPVTVLNKITGKPVVGVTIKALQTTAKTNVRGKAVIALPADDPTVPGALAAKGYNDSKATIQVTDSDTKANTVELTPSGHIYFLSNRSGKLDVVKTDLDGTNRKTVLEGTGNEDKNSTSLLASRDWRYLVLKAKRDTPQEALYLIDTVTDKVTQFDSGDVNFTLVGWYDHAFIYSINRPSVSYWQPGSQVLKSYDAERQQLNQLDQNQAEGDANNYAYQSFGNFYILKNAIVYTAQWYGYNGGYTKYDYGEKNDSIRSVEPDGQNKKDQQTFPTKTVGSIGAALYGPQEIYYELLDSTSGKRSYYEYEDGAVKASGSDTNIFNQTYPTYLLSPSSSLTFWSELRDGKNTLFTGDAAAKTKKQLTSSSEYAAYGWYSDNYVLVSKDSSELYITAPAVLAANGKPLKITDYYKPAQTYAGYGYGYGGL